MSRATRFARGSTETGDLTENLQIYPRAANSAAESGRGCFHSGFLSRAQLFPLQERGGTATKQFIPIPNIVTLNCNTVFVYK